MGLSSNTIIHFTKKKSSLIGILSDNFQIRYCHETVIHQQGNYNFLVPIVSFCDIPFSQITNHINNYGCYGIGLSKKWAESKGLNPVLYIEKNSILSEHITTHAPRFILDSSKTTSIIKMSADDRRAFDFIRYLKNYQGILKRKGAKDKKDYRFSDEREWRYALNPSIQHQAFGYFEHFSEKNIALGKNSLNKKIESERLKFSPKDINYIIIKKEEERDSIIKIIENTKEKYSFQEVKRLASRIISTEQLKTDF